MEVLQAAKPFVDVLSFQDFRNPAAHLCGAYIRNKVRKRGLIDRNDEVNVERFGDHQASQSTSRGLREFF